MTDGRSYKPRVSTPDGPATDWVAWHREYEDPESRLSQRVREVQRQLVAAIDRAPLGPIRIISACAGEGRDIIPVVTTHARCADVSARLVEFDTTLAARARSLAPANVEVVTGDASISDAYADAVPANIAVSAESSATSPTTTSTTPSTCCRRCLRPTVKFSGRATPASPTSRRPFGGGSPTPASRRWTSSATSPCVTALARIASPQRQRPPLTGRA